MTALSKLRELAMRATGGEWIAADGPMVVINPPSPDFYKQSNAVIAGCGSKFGLIPHGILFKDDAEYIAAANPQTVLSLLDVVDAAVAFMDARGDDNESFVRLRDAVRRVRDGK